MDKIIKYVENHDDFNLYEFYEDIKDLMEDLEYLKMHHRRNRVTNYNVKIIPYKRESDRVLFDYLVSWCDGVKERWIDMFYIRQALEYLFKENSEEDWGCDFEMYKEIEQKLDDKEINLRELVPYYFSCNRSTSRFFQELREYEKEV